MARDGPHALQQLHARIQILKQPLTKIQKATEQVSKLGQDSGEKSKEVVVKNPSCWTIHW